MGSLKNVIFSSMMLLVMVFTHAGFSAGVAEAAIPSRCSRTSNYILGFPTWYKYLEPSWDPATQGCELNFKFPEDLAAIVFALFEILLRFAGVISVLFVMFGGFMYMTSQGEPERSKAGRTIIVNALVGLMIAILATAIVNLVARNIA